MKAYCGLVREQDRYLMLTDAGSTWAHECSALYRLEWYGEAFDLIDEYAVGVKDIVDKRRQAMWTLESTLGIPVSGLGGQREALPTNSDVIIPAKVPRTSLAHVDVHTDKESPPIEVGSTNTTETTNKQQSRVDDEGTQVRSPLTGNRDRLYVTPDQPSAGVDGCLLIVSARYRYYDLSLRPLSEIRRGRDFWPG